MRFDWTGASPETTTGPVHFERTQTHLRPLRLHQHALPIPISPISPISPICRGPPLRQEPDVDTPDAVGGQAGLELRGGDGSGAEDGDLFTHRCGGEAGKGSAHGGWCRVDRIASAHPYTHINEINNPNHPHYSRTTPPAASTLATVDSIPIRHRLPPLFPSFASFDAAESEASEGASKMAMSCPPKSARTWAAEVGLTWPKLFWGCWVVGLIGELGGVRRAQRIWMCVQRAWVVDTAQAAST